MKRILLIISILLFNVSLFFAQSLVTGQIRDMQGNALQSCTVLFLHTDSIFGGTITDSKGRFELKNLIPGNYVYKVSMIGFKTIKRVLQIDKGKNQIPIITLEEDITMLKEIEVTGEHSKISAGLTTYYLTEQAKKSKTAYEALREIPQLIVNPIARTISLDNGKSPLILIDGIQRKDYINILNPENIESVEIMDNPTARYMGDEGVSCILNIKLRRIASPVYFRGNLQGRSSVNWDQKNINADIEIGNALSAVYLTGAYFDNTNKDENISNKLTGNSIRHLAGESTYKNKSMKLTLGGDKVFSEKNYIAYSVFYMSNPYDSQKDYTGNMSYTDSDWNSDLKVFNCTDNAFHLANANLYWRHNFTKNQKLELTGSYDYSTGESLGKRTEKCELYDYSTQMEMENSKHTGKLNIDYQHILKNKLTFSAGSNTEYSATHMDDIYDRHPEFPYKRCQEYAYIELDNNRTNQKFNYVLSLGMDFVFSNADGTKNNYTKILPSVSLAYRFNKNNSLSLNYKRNRTSPNMNMLNPRNTSMDSLNIKYGNPYLKPYTRDMITLRYRFKYKKFEAEPYIDYRYFDDMFMEVGKIDGNIYSTTYENLSHKNLIILGSIFRYRLSSGGISTHAYYRKDDMKNMSYSGDSWGASLNFWKFYKKISFSFSFQYDKASYSYISKNEPSFGSHFNFSWKLSNDWNVYVDTRGFLFHKQSNKSWTRTDNYWEYSSYRPTNRRPELCFSISYNFKNKIKSSNRQKKKFNTTDMEMKEVSIQ